MPIIKFFKPSLVCILSFFLLSYLPSGFAQENGSQAEDDAKAEKKANRKAEKERKISEGRSLIFPVAAPAYTPELGGMIAAGGLWSFKTNRFDSLIQRSSMAFTLAYTTTGAIVGQARPTTFWFKDKLRINVELWFKDMPDNYWGVGSENGSTTPESDSTTAYQRQWFWFMPQFLYQVKKYHFIGLNVDLNYTQGSDESEGVASDPDYLEYNDKPFNAGLGLILRHDSRDIPVNAWKGTLLDLTATFYGPYIGGNNEYQIYVADWRQYHQVGREGQTLAYQVRTRLGFGDVPYGEMGQLGTPFDLRGYYWGRYRDKSLFFFLPEYRHTFYKENGEKSIHGMVGWVGTGAVFDVEDTDGVGIEWLPNFGVGYRLELQPRMNLRIDVGIGRETAGFYFNFNEAF